MTPAIGKPSIPSVSMALSAERKRCLKLHQALRLDTTRVYEADQGKKRRRRSGIFFMQPQVSPVSFPSVFLGKEETGDEEVEQLENRSNLLGVE